MPAAAAADAEIHADTQHLKHRTAAGVRLFHNDLITDLYIHAAAPFRKIPHFLYK